MFCQNNIPIQSSRVIFVTLKTKLDQFEVLSNSTTASLDRKMNIGTTNDGKRKNHEIAISFPLDYKFNNANCIIQYIYG